MIHLNTFKITNNAPFAVKIVKTTGPNPGTICNLLQRNQSYYQEFTAGDLFEIRHSANSRIVFCPNPQTPGKTDYHPDGKVLVIDPNNFKSGAPPTDSKERNWTIYNAYNFDLFYQAVPGQTTKILDNAAQGETVPKEQLFPDGLYYFTLPGKAEHIVYYATLDEGKYDAEEDTYYYSEWSRSFNIIGGRTESGKHVFDSGFENKLRLSADKSEVRLYPGEVILYQSVNYNDGAREGKNSFWILGKTCANLQNQLPFNDGVYSVRSFKPGPNTILDYSTEDGTVPGITDPNPDTKKNILSAGLRLFESAEKAGIKVSSSLSQDMASSVGQTAGTPSNADQNGVSVYRTTLEFQDKAVKQAVITAAADVDIFINGTKYSAGPNTPVRVDLIKNVQEKTAGNAWTYTRKIVITQAVDPKSLHVPEFIIQTDVMSKEKEWIIVHPDAITFNNLANGANSNGAKVDLSAKMLENFNTEKNVSLDQNSDGGRAIGQVAQALQGLAKSVVQSYHEDPTGVHSTRVVDGAQMHEAHWKISLGADNAAGIKHEAMTKSDFDDYAGSAQHYKNWAQGQTIALNPAYLRNPVALGSFLHDLSDAFEDVEHFGASVVKRVEAVTDDLVDDVKNLAHDISETLISVVVKGKNGFVKFVCSAVEEMVHILHKILDAVVMAINKLIEFLRFLFSFNDIINTTWAVRNTAGDFAGMADNKLKSLIPQAVKDKIKEFDDDYLKKIEKYLPSNNGSQSATNPGGSEALEKLEWIISKISHFDADPDNFKPEKTFPAIDSDHNKPELAVMNSLTSNCIGPAVDNFQNIRQVFGDMINHPDKLKDDFIQGLTTLIGPQLQVVNSMESMADEIVQLLESGSVVTKALNKSDEDADIPVLKELYDFFFTLPFIHSDKPPFSYLTLVSLAYAVPVTLLYKSLQNGDAPFDGKDGRIDLGSFDHNFMNPAMSFGRDPNSVLIFAFSCTANRLNTLTGVLLTLFASGTKTPNHVGLIIGVIKLFNGISSVAESPGKPMAWVGGARGALGFIVGFAGAINAGDGEAGSEAAKRRQPYFAHAQIGLDLLFGITKIVYGIVIAQISNLSDAESDQNNALIMEGFGWAVETLGYIPDIGDIMGSTGVAVFNTTGLGLRIAAFVEQ